MFHVGNLKKSRDKVSLGQLLWSDRRRFSWSVTAVLYVQCCQMGQLSWGFLKTGNILSMRRPRHILWNFLSIQMFNACKCVTAVERPPFKCKHWKTERSDFCLGKNPKLGIFVRFDLILFLSLCMFESEWSMVGQSFTFLHWKTNKAELAWFTLGCENCRFQAWTCSFPKPLQWRFESLP